jgi:hypothetical protein
MIEFAKHYIFFYKIISIIGKFECGIRREPGLGNICELRRYWGVSGSARRERDRVKSGGRKIEDKGLRLVVHAEVSERRVHLRKARE